MNTRTGALLRTDFDHDHGYRTLILGYRRHLRARGLSDGTVAIRVLHVEQVHARHSAVLDVETEDLELMLSQRRHTHAAESRRAMRSSWQSFYGWALRAGHAERDPSAELAPIRVPRAVARIADDAQLRVKLASATTAERAMILLGRDAGLRLREISSLHMSAREGDVLRIVGKGDHTRMVPTSPALLEVLLQLERLYAVPGYYFPGRFGGYMHPQSVCKIIRRAAGSNPHSLRHAAATAAYTATKDIRGVQQMLGHVSLATTERYVHVRPDQLRPLINAGSLQTRTAMPTEQRGVS